MNKFIKWVIYFFPVSIFAQNPIITNIFSADPSAHVFNGRVYVYPSHDIRAPEGKGLRSDWFCMEDYHVFSSDDLVNWKDHGVILTQYQVPWIDSTTYSFWAPDCIERNGKYYLYFPSISHEKDSITGRKMFRIGVAVAHKPEGPFMPQPQPIKGVIGIDPCVFIDKDGQAYLYWSLGNIYVAKLKDNMLEIESEPKIIANLPEKGLKEGPWVFERNGIYYLTFPHVENKIERLEYAVGEHPMGPFKMAGVIMDESPMNCWTNHHSIIEHEGQWYLFYHQNYLSPEFDKNRSVCIDSLFFNSDGTIRKVIPTLRGVGITDASQKIELDRYSSKSGNNISVLFNDTLNPFAGWKIIFHDKNAWIQYNKVDFRKNKYNKITMRVYAQNGGALKMKLEHINGQAISNVVIPPKNEWQIIKSKITKVKPDLYDIVVMCAKNSEIELDWIIFE